VRRSFVDVDSWQTPKRGQLTPGDVFLCQKLKEEDRTLAVLSDGLGSGIKANVLATLTATMAMKYVSGYTDIMRSAETIMDTLPICSVRKISYSTFTIADVESSGETRIIEYDNPPFLLLRNGRAVPPPKRPIALRKWQHRTLQYSEIDALPGDRIVFFSDGVTQAGMGAPRTPLGWTVEHAGEFAERLLARDPAMTSRQLAREIGAKALAFDCGHAKDDITCGVLHIREPRSMLVVTGPPFFPARDHELGRMISGFRGTIAICGGTTANIVSRVLCRPLAVRLEQLDPEVPPAATMDGINLVTEGTITLGRVASLLEAGTPPEGLRRNAATELLGYLINSDVITFVVGTRVNQAHQDPGAPVEMDLRRNIVKRIAGLLESKYMKETAIQYM
jgi:hypothetical protein